MRGRKWQSTVKFPEKVRGRGSKAQEAALALGKRKHRWAGESYSLGVSKEWEFPSSRVCQVKGKGFF